MCHLLIKGKTFSTSDTRSGAQASSRIWQIRCALALTRVGQNRENNSKSVYEREQSITVNPS